MQQDSHSGLLCLGAKRKEWLDGDRPESAPALLLEKEWHLIQDEL